MVDVLQELDANQKQTIKIVLAYPVVVALVSVLLNVFVLDVSPFVIALPSHACLFALSVLAVLFCINHTWLLTATELVRVRYKIRTTPEEWHASEVKREDISQHAHYELERTHNAHRNTNENALYFALLALPFVFVSPTNLAALSWLILFPLARLGYTYSYLTGKDGLRSLCMTLGLLAMYGLASYLILSLIYSFI